MHHVHYFLRSATDWIFRKRHPGLALIRWALFLAAFLAGGLAFSLTLPFTTGPMNLSYTTDTGPASVITWILLLLVLVLVAVGLWLLFADRKQLARQRVIAVEFRGLHDGGGAALEDAVPDRFDARRDGLVMDVRQGLIDGVIVDPEVAVRKLASLRDQLASRESGRDRRDLRYVVGGIAPVPLLFLAGLLLDDETPVTFMDWDRSARIWRELDGPDDGARFTVSGLDALEDDADAIVLAIGYSFPVDLPAAQARVGDLPVVALTAPSHSTTTHWSEDKQKALSQQLIDVMIAIKGKRAKLIHIFLAAPASLTLRFGTHYDQRLYPRAIVHQYEGGSPSRFSWAIRLPTDALHAASVIPADADPTRD
ncbi:SAVED domain-containing protein [Brevundimonas sp.]